MGLAILTLGIFAITNGSEASKQTCHEFVNGTLTVNGTLDYLIIIMMQKELKISKHIAVEGHNLTLSV